MYILSNYQIIILSYYHVIVLQSYYSSIYIIKLYILFFPFSNLLKNVFFTLCFWVLMPSVAFKLFGSLFQAFSAKYESSFCPWSWLVFRKG